MALTVPEIDDNDPVITRLTTQHQKRAAVLRGSMYEALDTNPDQFAEQQRIAKQLGHTAAVVNELPELAKDAKLQQIEKNITDSPALKQKMADDIAFAKLAHDDTDNLSLTEKALSTIKNIGRSTKAALHGFNESVYGVAQSVTDIGAAALDPLVGTVLPANPFGLMSEASNNQRLKEKEIKQALEKARGDVGPTENAIYSGVQSATQSLLTLPLALMTRNPNVFSGTMAAQTGGQAYGEAIDAGKSPGQALPFAVSQGAIEYATEQLPAIKLLDGLKAKAPALQIAKDFLAREIPGEQLATVLQDANDWAVLNPDKPFSEFIKERPGAAYQTLVSTVVGGSIQVGAGKALEYTANRFADRNKAEEVANQEYQAFQELDKLAANSKVRARDSETFQRFVETALEDGPVQDVYIDANTLAQSGVVEELAKVSPAISEQFEQALQMGGSVRIPFAEYASQIAGTQFNQTLLQHLKTDPNGLTKAEAEEHAKSYQQEFSKELDSTIQEQANDEAFKTSAATVQSEIAKQITSTNRFTADVAEANALVAASHYAVRAAQLGISPEDLYKNRPLKVTGERITGGLEQSNAQLDTPQFREWFGDSKVTGTDGRPQLVYHGTGTDFNEFDSEAGVHFFTPSETEAKGYGSRQIPVYLAIQNPAPHSVFERTMTEIEQGDNVGGYDGVMSKTRDALIAQGYDGARYNGAYLAFYPEQIKSAEGNNGNFDPNDPNILHQTEKDYNQPYETDLFGNPVPTNTGKSKTAGRSADSGNLTDTPESGVQDTPAPAAEYIVNTIVGSETRKKIGASKITNAAEAAQATTYLYKSPVERLDGIVTDAAGKPLGIIGGFKGAVTESAVYPATLMAEAVRIPGAAKLWLSHNHPSGLAELSNADINLYAHIKNIFEGSGIELAGLLAVAQNEYASITESGEDSFQAIPAPSGSASIPVIERELVDSQESDRGSPITSPQSAMRIAKLAYEKSKQNGIILTDAQNRMTAWLPLSDLMVGQLRNTGGLNQLYRAISQANANAAFIVHDGSLNVRAFENGQTPIENIGKALANVKVHLYDAINVSNGTTYSEQGKNLIGDQLYQANRGAYSPTENTIALLKNADLSTFLHELGHAFLTMDVNLASELAKNPQLSEGEQEIIDDVSKLFDWFGIQGDIHAKLDQWFSMSINEQRAHHEKLAEGFESYLFEGKAPSLELQPLFQRMRAWFINVYRNMMSYLTRSGETLTPEVRAVFDRMLASTEQIKLAQQARSMMPLFQTAEQAGMTIEEFAAYQKLDPQATQDAIAELQTRGLRDMQWLNNARSKVLKKLQKEVSSLRREARMEASTEILSQPVYRAWTFLTAKQTQDDKLTPVDKKKSDPNVVDETRDNIFTAIAKLGGLNKDELIATWGIDTYGNPQSGVFGKPVWRVKGGLSIDGMAELLAERGYLKLDKHGKYDLRDFEDAFNEQLSGNKQVSLAYDYSQDQEALPGANINVNALGSGRLDRMALKEMYGQDDAAMRSDGLNNLRMTSDNGLHPDIVADMFGFSSGDELVKALLAADPPRQAIEDLTDTKMLERHGDISTPEALGRAADKAIHNEVRARMISTELNVLAKITGKRATLAKAARDFANEIVARLKIRDIRPNQYAVAEAKAAKNAASAMKKNDLETAAAEKRNQLVSNYATKAALNAKDEVDKGIAYLRKFGKEGVRKSLDVDYLDQIDALLDRFDLRTSISLKNLDKRAALVDWVNKQRDQGFEPDVPQDLMNEALRMPYKNMTLESFRGLVDTVKQIEHLGRLKNYLLTAKEQRTYEAIRDEIVFGIESQARGRKANTRTPTTDSGRMIQGLKNFWASHVKAATWARVMDGGKDGGPVWEYFIRSANEAADFETTERGKATEALSKTLAPVFALGKMGGKGQYFPSIDRSLNRESRIAIALNTGNAGNLQRLLDGEGWTYQQLQPVLDSLSKAEWDAVQSIWDFFESYRPLIAAKERRVYGKEPNWIEPTPVQTKHGEYRGGYYPVKYDPAASQRAEEHIDAEEARQQIQGAYTSATTRRSFTKNRVEEVKGRPLLYTLGGVYSGVNEVIHDLAWHEWLIDANRLMRSSTIDGAIRNHYGPEVKRQFKSWIQDMATGERGADNIGEKVLGKLRQGVSIAGLGFNVLSAAIQVTGFSQSIVRVGAKWVGRGVTKYVANPVKTTREVTDASEFMASRFRTQFRELNELRNQVQDQSAARSAMQNSAYFMMTRVQQMVDVPTWLGAYEKAISQGNDEAKAVSLADQAVIDSQMSGMTKDLSEIERGGPAMKLFTVFYSYMNTTFNLGVMRYMTEANKAKLAADYLLLYVATPVLGLTIKNALTPGDAEDDWNLEALAKALLGESIGFMMGQMVIVREFAEAAKSALGLSHGAGYQGPAGVRVVNDATKFAQQAQQGEFDDAFRKASINLISSLFGLPGAQINRTITGAQALSEGDTENPAAVMFGYQEAR